MAVASVVLALAATGLMGCAARSIGPLSAQEIAAKGTMKVAAPRETVFDACLLALRMEGYEIQIAEPDTALAVAWRRRGRMGADDAAGRRSRGYVVEVRDAAGGGVSVTVTPAAGSGEHRLEDPIWDLEHERAQWSRLFEDVRTLMARMAEGEN